MKNQIKHKIPKYKQTVLQCLNAAFIIQIVLVSLIGLSLIYMLAMSSEEHTKSFIFYTKLKKNSKRHREAETTYVGQFNKHGYRGSQTQLIYCSVFRHAMKLKRTHNSR